MKDEDSTNRYFFDQNMEDAEVAAFAGGHFGAFTSRSPEKEDGQTNEDAIGLFPIAAHSGVIAVADGCGGLPRGNDASKIAIDEIGKSLAAAAKDGSDVRLRTTILNGVEHANLLIKDLGAGAGTTLIIATIEDYAVRSFQIGDSGMLMVGNRGKLRFQTISHSPVGYAIEAGMLDEKGAMFHEDRNIVSNLMGFEEMRVDMGPKIEMQALDTLVLGTDGLFDNLHQKEIVDIIRKGPLKAAARRLREACRQRMRVGSSEKTPSKPDDLAFVIFRRR